MSEEEKYKSEVHMEYTDEETNASIVKKRKYRSITLKGQEATKRLIELARKELDRDFEGDV